MEKSLEGSNHRSENWKWTLTINQSLQCKYRKSTT